MSNMILTPGPLPGSRKLPNGIHEDGAILAFRKDGDEVLYAAQTAEQKGLIWIPVGEFVVHPGELEPQIEEESPPGEGESGEPDEVPSPTGPFPEKAGDGVRRRPTVPE